MCLSHGLFGWIRIPHVSAHWIGRRVDNPPSNVYWFTKCRGAAGCSIWISLNGRAYIGKRQINGGRHVSAFWILEPRIRGAWNISRPKGRCRDADLEARAARSLVVRGAPALGSVGVVLWQADVWIGEHRKNMRVMRRRCASSGSSRRRNTGRMTTSTQLRGTMTEGNRNAKLSVPLHPTMNPI